MNTTPKLNKVVPIILTIAACILAYVGNNVWFWFLICAFISHFFALAVDTKSKQ